MPDPALGFGATASVFLPLPRSLAVLRADPFGIVGSDAGRRTGRRRLGGATGHSVHDLREDPGPGEPWERLQRGLEKPGQHGRADEEPATLQRLHDVPGDIVCFRGEAQGHPRTGAESRTHRTRGGAQQVDPVSSELGS